MTTTLAIFLAVFGGLLLAAGFLDEIAARVRLPGIVMVLLLGLLTDNRLETLPGQPPAGLQADHPGPAAASNSQARSATTLTRARHGGRAQRLRGAGGEGVKAGAGAPRSNRCVMHQ